MESPTPPSTFQRLNRKIHIYAGLFATLYILLFAISGIVLNHRLKIWDWFSNRVEKTREVAVTIPTEGSDLQKARTILRQLAVDGEIHRIVSEPAKGTFSFDTQRPGQFASVKLDATTGKGTLKTSDFNSWSILYNMHILTGHGSKNWIWANVWKVFSDLTALIMVVLTMSGLVMWWNIKSARRWGLICLEIGAVLFVFLTLMLSKFNF